MSTIIAQSRMDHRKPVVIVYKLNSIYLATVRFVSKAIC